MEDVKVTVTNLNGRFSLGRIGANEVVELDRYDSRDGAVAALNAQLGADPVTLAVQDLQGKEEVYRVAWLGTEKPAKK